MAKAQRQMLGGLPPPDFESSEQTIVSSGVVSVAHSIGSVPALFTVAMRCKTAELGYAVNDEIVINYANVSGSWVFNSWVNATNIGLTLLNLPNILNKAGATGGAITAANWRWVLRAWK